MPADSPSLPPVNTASLPPVNPPTGKFIVQLFLVPGLIVALIVCLLLLVNWLFSGPRSPQAYLGRLDDSNSEVRWRAASDLSQVLKRDQQLASNADFCQELTRRLVRAVRGSQLGEMALLDKFPVLETHFDVSDRELSKEAQQQRARLQPERDYIQFLTASLGNFLVPTGAPVLGLLAEAKFPGQDRDDVWIEEQKPSLERRALTLRRRGAIWALANLGEKLRRFQQLPAIEQNLILDQLRKLGESTQGASKQWNQAALECLEKRQAGQYTTMDVDRSLIKATEAEDPVIRFAAAYALGFWKGDVTQNQRVEKALERLSSDDGRGMDRMEEFQGPDLAETTEILSQPGLIIQINATLSLLRLGSSKARASRVKEMLNEKQLGEDIQIQSKNGKREPNVGKAAEIVAMTLKALSEYYRHNPADSLPGIPERIQELTTSSNAAIRMAALETAKALK